MILVVVAILMIFIDQGVKFLTVTNFSLGEGSSLIPGVISLTRVHNTGVAFSIGSDVNGIILAGISFLIALIVVVLLATKKIKARGQRWALTFVVAGAVSNALDRLVSSYVVDMFKLEFISFGIFNVADICIVCGIIVFAILWIKGDSKTKTKVQQLDSELMYDTEETSPGGSDTGKDEGQVKRPKDSFSRDFDLPVDSFDVDVIAPDDEDKDSPENSFTLNDILREFGEGSDDE